MGFVHENKLPHENNRHNGWDEREPKGAIKHMIGLILSLIVGLLLACLSLWTVSQIIDRYTKWEKNLCRLLSKRGKEEDPPMLSFPTAEGPGAFSIPGRPRKTEKKHSLSPRYRLVQSFQAICKNRFESRRNSRRYTAKGDIP